MKNIGRGFSHAAFLGLGLAFATAMFAHERVEGHEVEVRREALSHDLEELRADHANDLIVLWSADAVPLRLRPYARLDLLKGLSLLPLGSQTRSPFSDDRCRQFGINDLYLALHERDDVVVITNHPIHLVWYRMYVERHYHILTKPLLIKRYATFTLYRFQRVPGAR